jgi:hypothetical protein
VGGCAAQPPAGPNASGLDDKSDLPGDDDELRREIRREVRRGLAEQGAVREVTQAFAPSLAMRSRAI